MALAKGPQTVAFENPIFDQLDDLPEMMAASLGEGGRLGLNDLDRIKVPNGTAVFMIPTLDGEESVRELSGVVIHARTSRSFWRQVLGTGDTSDSPPDCYSDDGVRGHGDPGTLCASCKFAEYGSIQLLRPDLDKSQAQACKQTQILFLFTEDGLLPKVLRLSPTSLRNWRQYSLRLMSRGIKLTDVVTKFTCKLVKNPANLQYVEISMSHGGLLSEETKHQIRQVGEVLVPKLSAPRPALDDIVLEPEDAFVLPVAPDAPTPPTPPAASTDPVDEDDLDAL